MRSIAYTSPEQGHDIESAVRRALDEEREQPQRVDSDRSPRSAEVFFHSTSMACAAGAEEGAHAVR